MRPRAVTSPSSREDLLLTQGPFPPARFCCRALISTMSPSDFLRRDPPFRLNALSTVAMTAGAIAASGSPWLRPVPSRHTAAAHAGDHVDGVTFVSVAVVAFADTHAARRSHSSALPSIPAEAAMTALRRVPVRCGLPVCPLARDGYWPRVSGMLRRGYLRGHDLPLASWGEGLPSRRTTWSESPGNCVRMRWVSASATFFAGVKRSSP